MGEEIISCSFCGMTREEITENCADEYKYIIEGPNANICASCVEIARDVIGEKRILAKFKETPASQAAEAPPRKD